MNLRMRIAAAAGAGLLVAAGAAAREKWIHAQTEHFEMFSCASESTSRELLAKLEQFRATILRVYPLRNNREPPTTVILFDTDSQFERYRPMRHGEHEEAGGYCVYDPAEAVIVLSDEYDRETTQQIIFHEYVHLLVGARGEHPPVWLNEGLAEFFSTFDTEKGRFVIGRHKPEHVDLLLSSHLMPLGHLFAITPDSPEYHEGSDRGILYAESWLLVHYALLGAKQNVMKPALARFVGLLETPGAAVDESFRQAFGMDYDAMESRLRDYLHGGGYHMATGPLPLGDLSSQLKFTPAGDEERELALADLRWRLQAPEDTTYRLMQSANQRPDSPRPYELLAIVASQGNDPEAALRKWQDAVERGSKNAYAYLVVARDRVNQLLAGFSPDYRLPADQAATLRGWLDRALELSPNYLAADEQLALVEAMAAEPRPAVLNRIQAVVNEMPDRSLTLFALAVVHWRVQHFELARQIDELLLKSPKTDPQVHWLAEVLHRRLPPPAPKPEGAAPPAAAGSEAPAGPAH